MSPLHSSKIMAFVAITDPARALQFYRDTLGLTFIVDESFALVFEAQDGIRLRLTKVGKFTPAPYTVLGWVVADIQAEVKALTARGVVFERFPGLASDDIGVCTFPGGDKVAWFKDPDGNTLSVTQF